MPALAAWLLTAALAAAAQTPATVDFTTIGPKIGETVPDFELADQHGARRKLSSLLGTRGTMLVFYRSADW